MRWSGGLTRLQGEVRGSGVQKERLCRLDVGNTAKKNIKTYVLHHVQLCRVNAARLRCKRRQQQSSGRSPPVTVPFGQAATQRRFANPNPSTRARTMAPHRLLIKYYSEQHQWVHLQARSDAALINPHSWLFLCIISPTNPNSSFAVRGCYGTFSFQFSSSTYLEAQSKDPPA